MGMIIGAKAICQKAGISESTLMDAILNRGLPARRNADFQYEISEKQLSKWMNADKSDTKIEEKAKAEDEADAEVVKAGKRKPGRPKTKG